MLNIYMYNSPKHSAVGFQTLSYSFDSQGVIDGNKNARVLLSGGGSLVVCADTPENTRVFQLHMNGEQGRVDTDEKWYINLVLESDKNPVSYDKWKKYTALFLLDNKVAINLLCDCLSVRFYNNKEIVSFDVAKFEESMDAIAEKHYEISRKNCGNKKLNKFFERVDSFSTNNPGQLWLLSTENSKDYYFQYTSAKYLKEDGASNTYIDRDELNKILCGSFSDKPKLSNNSQKVNVPAKIENSKKSNAESDSYVIDPKHIAFAIAPTVAGVAVDIVLKDSFPYGTVIGGACSVAITAGLIYKYTKQ